jgi:hypothetical protein
MFETISGVIFIIKHKIFKGLNSTKFIVLVWVILSHALFISDAPGLINRSNATNREASFQKKIEDYKKFKEQYEDKDFELNSQFVTRTRQTNGTSRILRFAVYNIEYGLLQDSRKGYNRNRTRIVRTPTRVESSKVPVCEKSFYVETYDETGLQSEIGCFEVNAYSHPISLIFNVLSEKELKDIVLINEFNDGDVDIQFTFEKATDGEFVKKILGKLKEADERNDQKAPQTKMDPIIPSEHQRISIAYIDDEDDGEPDFVLLPYCINGSYFDQDPYNNAVQVGLKYKLITNADLAGKSSADRRLLKKRLGLWMWDKPTEILISFCENPGPDIVFYDLGKVVNGIIVDPKPDGEFDKYEFLY